MSANPARGHERRDVHAKWVFAVVFLLFLFGLSLHGIIACFMKSLDHIPSSADLWNPAKGARIGAGQPGFPVLQVSPRLDLEEFRRREDAELNSYGWINRTAGIVRVPIEQAMNLVLQEGLPVRSGTNDNRLGPSPDQLIQQRTGGNQ